MRATSRLVAIVSAVLVAAGCGAADMPTGSASPETASLSTPPPTAALTTQAGVTGFGAAVADWNSAHTASPLCSSGACYDPDPSLPQLNGHVGLRYTVVQTSAAHVIGYTLNFPQGTSQATASAATIRELPSDAQVSWSAPKDQCYQVELASGTLGEVFMAASLGDAHGLVLAELESASASSYSSASVASVTLQMGGFYAGPADAPPC